MLEQFRRLAYLRRLAFFTGVIMAFSLTALVCSLVPFLTLFSIGVSVTTIVLIGFGLYFQIKLKGESMVNIVSCMFLVSISLFYAINVYIDNPGYYLSETNLIISNELSFEFSDYLIRGNETSISGEIELTISNKTHWPGTYVINIEALDIDGKILDEDVVHLDNIEPGEVVKTSIFTSTDVEDIRNITNFHIREITKKEA